MNLERHYDIVDKKLRELSEQILGLDASERDAIQMFLEAGEFGVAIQTIIDIYIDTGKTISPTDYRLVVGVIEEMEMDEPRRLKQLANCVQDIENTKNT